MLQDIRQNIQGTAAKIVVGLIVVSFAFFGIESILLSGGGSGIAEVNGEQISPNEVQQMVNTERRRLISLHGNNIDPAMLDNDRLSALALQTVINRKLQTQAAAEMTITASEGDVSALITGMGQFQVDGQFSPDMYRSLLSNAGYSPSSFKAGLKEDLILNQLRSDLAGTDFATPAELNLNARVGGELRDIRYLTIPLASFNADIEVTEEEIAQYYEENSAEFMSRESLILDYIELNVDDFRQDVEPQVVLEQYDLEKSDYAYATENRVSHILFIKGEGESSDALQSRVSAALAGIAQGKEFSDLAGSLSDDIGSASAGGDLGFSAGDTFPAEMEEAIAQLEPGEISPAVETDAGIHIIKLTERRDGKMPTLEEMRAELTERIQLESARADLLSTTESLKDYVFNAEDLSDPAQKLGLKVARSEAVNRSQQEGLFANTSLLAAAFSEDVLEGGHNSDVVELSGDKYVVLRVHQHKQAEVKPLSEVRQNIVAGIANTASIMAIQNEAQRTLSALRSGMGVEEFSNHNSYPWQVELAASRRNVLVPAVVLQRVFSLPTPAQGSSEFDFVQTPGGDVIVFELFRVTAGEYSSMAGKQKIDLEAQVTGEFAGLTNIEFQNALRERADITTL